MFKNIKQQVQQSFSEYFSNTSSSSVMYGLIALLVILGPLFVIPMKAFPIMASKSLFAFFLGIIGIIIYGIVMLRKGLIILPKNGLFKILGLIIITGLVGALISGTPTFSLFGYGFETTSWFFLFLFSLFTFFAYSFVDTYKRIGLLYGGLMVVFLVMVVVHILRYAFGPAFANIGILTSSVATLFGSWGDLGIFFGFIALLSGITLELAGLKKIVKWIVFSMGIIAVVFLAVMNIKVVWVVLGFVSLVLTLYLFSFAYWDTETKTYRKSERVPWFILGLFIIAMVCIFFGGAFNTAASKVRDLRWSDVRPSWSMTTQVAKQSFRHNFVTGYGPNGFNTAWNLAKPVALSGVDTARSDLSQGVGFIPTQIAINGVIGAILWILLSGIVLRVLIKKTRAGFSGSLDRYFSIGMGTGILYLGALAWVYNPGMYWLLIWGILIGAFLSLFTGNQDQPDRLLSFIKDPRVSFFGILGITLLILGALIIGYIGVRKTISLVDYSRGITFLNQGKLSEANAYLSLAAVYANHDIYHTQLTKFATSDLVQISSQVTETNKSSLSKQAEQVIGVALGHAQAALATRKSNYKNWIVLGDVYRIMVSFGISDAYANALTAYQEAQKRSPHDSSIVLYKAQLALAQNDYEGALGFVKESIAQYPTADAYIVRAQIQLRQQKFDAALDSLKSAVGVSPYNTDLIYQYGLLLINQHRYEESIPAFQRVIVLDNKYASAYVYLGYAYERVGDLDNATRVYEYIKKQFPGGADAIAAVKKGERDEPNPTATPDSSTDTSKLPAKKTVAPTPKK